MPDAPTPLDLDAIRERATQGYPFLGLWAACNDALVLVAENERLRAENERLRTICAGPPRHITAEDLEGLATSMLTARPAPAWDEEVAEAAVEALRAVIDEALADALGDTFSPSVMDDLTRRVHANVAAALPLLTAAPSATRDEVEHTPSVVPEAVTRGLAQSIADALLARYDMTPKEDR